MTPTLDRLGIGNYDMKMNMEQLQVRHMNEYMHLYRKELHTDDIDFLKKFILRNVYKEIIQTECRLKAKTRVD